MLVIFISPLTEKNSEKNLIEVSDINKVFNYLLFIVWKLQLVWKLDLTTTSDEDPYYFHSNLKLINKSWVN
jgi:hypothetical protein